MVSDRLTPRKHPVQRRAMAMVDAIIEGAIQVLTREGLKTCTTTRIAARAGVSVGTLYQYFPNRDAVLAGVLERHLEQMCENVERRASPLRGRSIDDVAAALPEWIMSAKLTSPDLARALYDFSQRHGGDYLIADATSRLERLIENVIASNSAIEKEEAAEVAPLLLSAYAGSLRTYLQDRTRRQEPARLRRRLQTQTQSYLATIERDRGQFGAR